MRMLDKKLLRDMRRSSTQFIALILLCVLGTFLFAGIDGVARMADATNRRYFTENRLADLWVTLPDADRHALARVRALGGVEDVNARFAMDMETALPGDPTLNVMGVDGAMTLNVPIIDSGEALGESDLRGCLLQAGFAEANGLAAGDALTVKLQGREYTFAIRGLCYSPEYVSVSNGVAANPLKYGYILVNAAAFEGVPLTQLALKLQDGADASAVRAAIADALPDAFVIDRKAHRSTAAAEDNVTMFRALSIVFPMASFVVAALIVMTTLTRMIDNQRMQIGTLRALGYSDRRIEWHYLSYAVWPSLIGSVLGAFVGNWTLPRLVWALLIGQSEYPYRIEPPVSLAAWVMVGVSVATSAAICLITYRRSARETAASLLRPKPPKAGKRNLLERWKAVWKRLSFNGKMVVRNLTRSKMRTMMSCVGLLCCNALIIASLGLQDSVPATAYNHYGGTLAYDVRAELNELADGADAYRRRLEAGRVECLMELSASCSLRDVSRTTLVTVVEDDQQLLRLGADETLVAIEPGTVALTDKLARVLDARVGDAIRFQLPADTESFVLTVGQIVYNNFSQGAYMTRRTYDGLRKGEFKPTAIELLKPTDACLALLDGMDEVKRVEYVAEQAREALNSFELVSSIFGILFILALALAFVICYNMGLINFAERLREYATLKVLGYHQKEIRKLILHENLIITAIAIAVSIVPGMAFTRAILSVCETEGVRYVTQVTAQSVAISCAITYAFSVFIQRLLARKVKTIVMVEALKSVE